MRIFLGDLFYIKVDSAGIPVPLNIALIASYIKHHHNNTDITLFKDPLEMYRAIEARPPDLIGLSNYSWNSNLNIAFIEALEKPIKGVPIIMGGPNIPIGSPSRLITFFKNRPFATAYVTGEGETNFLYIVDYLIKNGQLDGLLDDAPQNISAFDHNENRVLNGNGVRLDPTDLDAVSSPYLSGMLDKFLDQNITYSPIFETNRGCPYSCSYCVWGQATESKIRTYNIDRLKAELQYCAEKPNLRGQLAFFADANFGILKRDIEIAEQIVECHKTYDFPNRLYMYFAKNPTKHGLKCAKLLSPLTGMTLSRQSMNPDALINVRRKNMNIEKYDETVKFAKSKGFSTGTEMIYGFPGETYKSYVKGIIELSHSAEFIQQYCLLLMWGSELSKDIYRNTHGIEGSWRPISGCWSNFGPFASVEFEEIVTQTNDMSFEDWKKIRLFHIFTQYAYADVFKGFRQSLVNVSINIVDFAERFMNDADNYPQSISKIIDEVKLKISDELMNPNLKDFNEHELTGFNNSNYVNRLDEEHHALAPFFKSMLHSKKYILDDLFYYFMNAVERWYGNNISKDGLDDLRYELMVSRALCIAYDEQEAKKNVQIGDTSLALYIDSEIAKALPMVNRGGLDSAYKIKMQYVISSRDNAFCYKIQNSSSQYRDPDFNGVTISQTNK